MGSGPVAYFWKSSETRVNSFLWQNSGAGNNDEVVEQPYNCCVNGGHTLAMQKTYLWYVKN